MKTIITSILLVFLSQQVTAKSFFSQLCEFNPNWEKYETRVPDIQAMNFTSDVEYIQAHLTTVLIILRSNSIEGLTDSQLNSRNHLIEVLDGYRVAGRFPINYYRSERIPVFIDEHDTHCAVGFLLQETGNESLAREIAAADNYIWVKDITDQRVIKWQEDSGFTLEELKIIQGAYDSYMPNALLVPNRYEIPQKPACAKTYFEDRFTGKKLARVKKNVWFHGEGENGVLNGRWEQNYAVGIPWIVGYYKNGKRTGQWMEYYQGTNILCRTENWRNDKLNGVRIRFDRQGNIIEEILFKNGDAVTKTNYDREKDRKFVRTPLDSVNLRTEVYTMQGRLLASGNEKVHNPGNLMWFQNIELTVLNSVAITAQSYEPSGLAELGIHNSPFGGSVSPSLFQTPPLVEYKKEGKWIYYHDADQSLAGEYNKISMSNRIRVDFVHYENELTPMIEAMGEIGIEREFDSLRVDYENDLVHDFFGYGENQYKHVHFIYHSEFSVASQETLFIDSYYYGVSFHNLDYVPIRSRISEVGEYDENGYRIGEWKHFDVGQNLFKVERYLIPHKEEELELGQN